jgi:predicted nucleic acid-binding Zn ribbon protein
MLSNDSQHIASVISHLTKGLGYYTDRVVQLDLPEIWTQTVGQAAANASSVEGFENGILKIAVRASVWRSELQLRKQDILSKINTSLGKTIVHDIYFVAERR